jgi:hypothetical protein
MPYQDSEAILEDVTLALFNQLGWQVAISCEETFLHGSGSCGCGAPAEGVAAAGLILQRRRAGC